MESEGETELPKVFNDPIHGHIEVDPLSVKIIDTPQFQRLRNIKQLGGGYWLYPGACHNRFEHSLGVYYLAGRLITELQEKQPKLKITSHDVLCVKIAGLCHDLGHGPFSHVFDQQFMKQAEPDCKWKHEDGSIDMFRHLISENDINLPDKDRTRTFIEGLINPPGVWPYEEKEKEKKSFLYQIVSNAENGMDVDKWDYFARDSHYTGLPRRFDHMRLIQSARVIKLKDGKWQICYRDKEWLNVYNMFYTRACLHREVYQHKTKVAVEMMITDALLKADECLDDYPMKISGAYKTIAVYTSLTDSVFDKILHPGLDFEKKLEEARDILKQPGGHEHEKREKAARSILNLEEARGILENLVKRKLYHFVGETEPKDEYLFAESKPSSIAAGFAGFAEGKVTAKDIAVNKVKVNYGKGKKNPVEDVRFWSKDKPDDAIPLEKDKLSQMLPAKFADNFVRVYCKTEQDKKSIDYLRKCFEKFLDKQREVKAKEELKERKECLLSDLVALLEADDDQSFEKSITKVVKEKERKRERGETTPVKLQGSEDSSTSGPPANKGKPSSQAFRPTTDSSVKRDLSSQLDEETERKNKKKK